MPRIPALGRLGQENCNEFEAKPGLCNKCQTSQRYIAEKINRKGQKWWYMPVISTLGIWRQEDQDLKTMPSCVVRSGIHAILSQTINSKKDLHQLTNI